MASKVVSLGVAIPAALRASREAIVSMRWNVLGEGVAGVVIEKA